MSARYRSVPCPKCNAKTGERCRRGERIDARTFRFVPMDPCHRVRVKIWVDQHKGDGA